MVERARRWAVEWNRSGRSFLWSLHSVAGTWCLLVYLLIALTGLYWSYGWYREGLVSVLGGDPPVRGKPSAPAAVDLTRVQASLDGIPQARRSVLDLRAPNRPGQPLSVRIPPADPAHSRAYDILELDPASGEIRRQLRYDEQPTGRRLLSSIFALHSGSFFGLPGRIAVMLASLCMSVFFVTGWMLYLDRRRKKRALRSARAGVPAAAVLANPGWSASPARAVSPSACLCRPAGQLQAAGFPAQVGRWPSSMPPSWAPRGARCSWSAPSATASHRTRRARSNAGSCAKAHSLPELGYALLAPAIASTNASAASRGAWSSGCPDRARRRCSPPWKWTTPIRGHCSAGSGSWRRSPGSTPPRRPRTRHWTHGRWPGANCSTPAAPARRCGGSTCSRPRTPPAGGPATSSKCSRRRRQRTCARRWRCWPHPDAAVQVDGIGMPLHVAAAERVLPASPIDAPVAHGTGAQAWLDALPRLPLREYSIASVASDGVLQLVVRLATRADGRSGT